MSHEITRMYASAATAAKAADELREEGYDNIFVVNPSGPDVPQSAIAAQIAEGRVYLADAKIYAKGVAAGHSLVTVHAPFGSGKLAEIVLDSHDPIDSGMPKEAMLSMWDEAAPLSSVLAMPTVIDDPDPMSRAMGIPAVSGSDCSLSGTLGVPLLTDGDMPAGRWGFRFLSNNPAPLSSLLGLPVLSKRQ